VSSLLNQQSATLALLAKHRLTAKDGGNAGYAGAITGAAPIAQRHF